jgi:hypothetical protein
MCLPWKQLFTNIENHVGFEVFTAVVMKSIIFWDMMLCSPYSSLRIMVSSSVQFFGPELCTEIRFQGVKNVTYV